LRETSHRGGRHIELLCNHPGAQKRAADDGPQPRLDFLIPKPSTAERLSRFHTGPAGDSRPVRGVAPLGARCEGAQSSRGVAYASQGPPEGRGRGWPAASVSRPDHGSRLDVSIPKGGVSLSAHHPPREMNQSLPLTLSIEIDPYAAFLGSVDSASLSDRSPSLITSRSIEHSFVPNGS
jgi:hypothetical protein